MFWGVESHCPVWIRNMSSSDLQSSMHARIHGMTIHTTGKLVFFKSTMEVLFSNIFYWDRRDVDPMVVGFTTTRAIGDYHH